MIKTVATPWQSWQSDRLGSQRSRVQIPGLDSNFQNRNKFSITSGQEWLGPILCTSKWVKKKQSPAMESLTCPLNSHNCSENYQKTNKTKTNKLVCFFVSKSQLLVKRSSGSRSADLIAGLAWHLVFLTSAQLLTSACMAAADTKLSYVRVRSYHVQHIQTSITV